MVLTENNNNNNKEEKNNTKFCLYLFIFLFCPIVMHADYLCKNTTTKYGKRHWRRECEWDCETYTITRYKMVNKFYEKYSTDHLIYKLLATLTLKRDFHHTPDMVIPHKPNKYYGAMAVWWDIFVNKNFYINIYIKS